MKRITKLSTLFMVSTIILSSVGGAVSAFAQTTSSSESTVLSPSKEEPTTGESQEPTTGESQEPTTGESQEPTTGESQEPTTGESQEPTTGESQEPTTGESQEPTTGESQEPVVEDKKSDDNGAAEYAEYLALDKRREDLVGKGLDLSAASQLKIDFLTAHANVVMNGVGHKEMRLALQAYEAEIIRLESLLNPPVENVGYSVKFLKKGTTEELATAITGSGDKGSNVTIDAAIVEGWTVEGPAQRTELLGESNNFVFYYTKNTVAEPELEKRELTASSLEVKVGENVTFTLTDLFSDGSTKNVELGKGKAVSLFIGETELVGNRHTFNEAGTFTVEAYANTGEGASQGTVSITVAKADVPTPGNVSVTIRYVDESGIKIAADSTMKGEKDKKGKAKAILIPGYTLKGNQEQEFTFTEGSVVVFNYIKDSVTPPIGAKLNLDELKAAIAAANPLKEADYTAASWKPFIEAKAGAEEILVKAEAQNNKIRTLTQTNVDAATKNLTNTQAALVKKTDGGITPPVVGPNKPAVPGDKGSSNGGDKTTKATPSSAKGGTIVNRNADTSPTLDEAPSTSRPDWTKIVALAIAISLIWIAIYAKFSMREEA